MSKKSKKTKEPEPAMEDISTRRLYVTLTPAEIALKTAEVLTAERLLGEAEREESAGAEAWKSEKASLADKVSTARAHLAAVGTIVREKREERDVQVEYHHDHSQKVVHTVRVDTGEIVDTRGMFHEELQSSLFEVKRLQRAEGSESAQA